MTDWLEVLADCRRRGRAAVLVTVAAVRGSAPRDAGARMVVDPGQSWGTIGGGQLEHRAIVRARALLGEGEAALLQRVPLGASLGQCCGGVVHLLFERVAPDVLTLLADGVPRNRVTIIAALVARHPRDDIKRTIARLAVLGQLEEQGGKYMLAPAPEPERD